MSTNLNPTGRGAGPASGLPDQDVRIGNEPTSGLWLVGFVVLLLFAKVTSLDPGGPACSPPLGSLPRSAWDPGVFHACLKGDSLPAFIGWDFALIVAYTWFFRECFRWSARCLGWGHGRRFSKRYGGTIIVGAALADVMENVLLLLARGQEDTVRPLVLVVSTIKWLFLILALLIVVMVLLAGARRFALPWTTPASTPPALPPYTTPKSVAAVSQVGENPSRWFVDADNKHFEPQDYAIGLSGGGIRSAAFCSGVLQILAESNWSPSKAAYLATVSGGGYVGVSSQMIRHCLSPDTPLPEPYAAGAAETEQLQGHHRYLGDDALGRVQLMIGIVTGLVLNAILVGGPLLLLGSMLALVPALTPAARQEGLWFSVAAAALALAVVATIFWQLGSADHNTSTPQQPTESAERHARRWRRVSQPLIVVALFGFLVAVPLSWWWAAAIAVLAIAGWLSRRVTRNQRQPSHWPQVTQALYSSGWLAVALATVSLTATGLLDNPTSWTQLRADYTWLAILGGSLLLLSILFTTTDQTWWSPHLFYKARLAATFAMERFGNKAQAIRFDTYTHLDEWAIPGSPQCPKILVCATANVEDLSIPPAGTRAVPFVFAHDYVGSPELGWWSTSDLRICLGQRLATDGSLQAAMAISGAAVASSGIGVKGRIPTIGTLFALVNARLGVWLPNPRAQVDWPSEQNRRGRWIRRRRPVWLWREVVGLLPSKKRYVYVSDGGHLDNLGLLELFRRRVRLIFIVDASADDPGTTKTLDWVLEMATAHLGITVDRPKTSPLNTATDPGEWPFDTIAADCVEQFTVQYPFTGENATVVIAKARFAATLADDADANDLRGSIRAAYCWRRWPWCLRSMPTTPTVNQFFTDELFDGYVRLGRAVGRRAVTVLGT